MAETETETETGPLVGLVCGESCSDEQSRGTQERPLTCCQRAESGQSEKQTTIASPVCESRRAELS